MKVGLLNNGCGKMMDLRRDEGCGVREGCGKTHWDEGGDGSYKGW